MASRWNAVECHVIPWDTEDCHSLCGFYAIPWHFIGIICAQGGMLWNAMEFHGIQWKSMEF